MSTDQDTVRSYNMIAAEYAAEAAAMPEWVATEIDAPLLRPSSGVWLLVVTLYSWMLSGVSRSGFTSSKRAITPPSL